ncbi:MAG: hypothetical protein M5U12_30475 [Verrucomicrobia bacterium]|nr:hypothetical protein [Verrucomicrobiota bacterium]
MRNPGLSYQWRHHDEAIPGATDAIARHLCIGLYDTDPTVNAGDPLARRAEFAWSSAEPVSFANWAEGEPNNLNGAGEFWGHMFAPTWQSEGQTIATTGEWNDVSDADGFGGAGQNAVVEVIPQVTAISPNSAVAESAGFTLSIQGNAFLRGAEILWNGSSRPTTCFNFGLVTAQIPASDLVSTPDLIVALVTLRNPGGGLSSPVPFTVKNASVGSVDGDSVVLSAAVYSGTPPGGPAIGAGGTYYDIQASGADASDSITARLFYPSTIAGSDESSLRLAWLNGTTWIPVKSSGDTSPLTDTTDNLDGTVSGGRFTVTFDDTGTPKITELAGTVFALADTTPVINSVVGPADPLAVGTSATVTVSFQAVGARDNQHVTFAWDDGSSTAVVPSVNGEASASHAYASASVNSVRVTVTDSNGDQATFGFVSKYQKGAKAQYKGTGTVNGLGNYGFLLTATDGQITGGGGSDRSPTAPYGRRWAAGDGAALTVHDNS